MYATAIERNQIVILIVDCTCMYFYVQWCVYIQIVWNPLIVVTRKDSWISLVPFFHEFETQRVIEQFISALSNYLIHKITSPLTFEKVTVNEILFTRNLMNIKLSISHQCRRSPRLYVWFRWNIIFLYLSLSNR